MFTDYKSIQKERMADILKTILGAKQITRGRLAEELGLSPSSIAKYIKTLKELGLVRESGRGISTGGRRSSCLEFDPEVGVNISVVFDLSSIKGALINPAGAILVNKNRRVYRGIPRRELLDGLMTLLSSLCAEAARIKKRIFGIGIGIGDHLDMDSGVSHYYHLSEDWKEVPLKKLIEKEFGLPLFLINDLDAGALGEKYYGAGVETENFCCVWIGETVGMGLVLNGQIYLGKNGFVGEIGHTRALPGGPLCLCGNRGCLETVTTESYILDRCREGLKGGVNSEAMRLCDGDREALAIGHIIEASNRGDRFCQNIFEETAEYLGRSLTDVANILNPELITLRGSVVDGNTFLYESVRRRIKHQALSPICDDIRVEHSLKREDIRLPGISSYILSRYFSRGKSGQGQTKSGRSF